MTYYESQMFDMNVVRGRDVQTYIFSGTTQLLAVQVADQPTANC